jgi:hypothetical protein
MYNKNLNKMNKETLRMQMLAGIITEGQYKEMLNETERIFKLKIINKTGPSTIQQVSADPSSTELFNIINLIKKSPNVKDVEILEDESLDD